MGSGVDAVEAVIDREFGPVNISKRIDPEIFSVVLSFKAPSSLRKWLQDKVDLLDLHPLIWIDPYYRYRFDNWEYVSGHWRRLPV